MEKKFKFRDNPNLAKTIYGIVIAVLCITAIIIGIVAANSRTDTELPEEPPIANGGENSTPVTDENESPKDPEPEKPNENKEPEKLTFISPVSGKISKNHSITTPVFSTTLEEWRVHTGIDISTEENAPVFAAAAGKVSSLYSDPLLGASIEITHEGGIKTVYSNLSSDSLNRISVGKTVECGEKIGTVGDSSISELAEETHLHFEILENGKSVDPMNYISEEAKAASLGIKSDE